MSYIPKYSMIKGVVRGGKNNMLAKLQMVLETEEKENMPYQKAIMLQSILMSQINQVYAEAMHESGLHPYRQSLENKEGKNIWSISVTNKEACDQIINPLLSAEFQEFFFVHDQCKVFVKEKDIAKIAKKEMTEKYYFEDAPRYMEIGFTTPVAFKSQNQYIFYPDLRLMYQSLMNKYEASSQEETMKSQELLEQMVANTNIVQYNLKSCYYSISKVKIPAFMGKIKLKVKGPQTLVNFANLLFRFGEYSGIGIKTAMGMGNMKIIERVRA